jgi:hypothetical protein
MDAQKVEKEREALRLEFDELAAVLSTKEDAGGARAVLLYRCELEAFVFRMVPRAIQVCEHRPDLPVSYCISVLFDLIYESTPFLSSASIYLLCFYVMCYSGMGASAQDVHR